MPGVKVGHVDIQFGAQWDPAKANQLVQSLQQTISAVTQLANTTVTPTPPSVAVHVLATQAGLGADHTVAGLVAGQVLVAQSAVTAHFAQLQFGQLAQTDSGTFTSPANGDVISFVNGYWSATPISGALGLTDPGANALLMWNNTGAGSLAWAIPGVGIKINAGNVSVDDTQLVHGHLLGLLADDHPQYALVSDTALLDAANVFTLVNTFQQGIVSNGPITLSGNLEQSGTEGTEWRLVNTADNANEGGWRTHVETGQLIFSTVQDDGSDGENWLSVQRSAELVDTIALEAASLTFNGADVLAQDKAKPPAAGYLPVLVAGVAYNLLTAGLNTVIGGFWSLGDMTLQGNLEQSGIEGTEWRLTNINDYVNEGAWRTHVETGQLIFSSENDDGSDGENWLSVQRTGELVETIAFEANSGSLTFNGFDVLCASPPPPGAGYMPATLAGVTYNLMLYAATGGGGSLTLTDGVNTVAGVTQISVTGGTVGGSTPNATLTITGGGSPGAPNTSVQFNNSGAFGGSANFTWSGSMVTVQAGAASPAMTLQSVTGQSHLFMTETTTTDFGGLRINNSTPNRVLEILHIGSGNSATYGAAANSNVINSSANAAGLVISTADLARVTVANTGAVVINAPSSSSALTVNGASGAYAQTIIGNSASTHSFGLLIQAGTGATDIAFEIENSAATKNFAVFWGDGHLELGPNVGAGTNGFVINTGGQVAINSPTSGAVTLTVTSPSPGGPAIQALGAGTHGGVIDIKDGGSSQEYYLTSGFIATGLFGLYDATRGAVILQANTTGNVSIHAPASGTALLVTGVANTLGNYAVQVVGSSTASNSWGLLVQAGTNSSDICLNVQTIAGSPIITVAGDGSGQIGPNGALGITWDVGGHITVLPVGSSFAFTVTSNSGLLGGLYKEQTTSDFGGFRINNSSGNRVIDVVHIGSANSATYGAPANANVLNASSSSAGLYFSTSDLARMNISLAGNVTIATPTSGVALAVSDTGAAITTSAIAVTVGSAGFAQSFSDGTNTQSYIGFGSIHELQIGPVGAFPIALVTSGLERGGMDTGGVFYQSQPTPTAINATATATIAQLLTLIITSTSAAAVTITLPTGALTEAAMFNGGASTNFSFDWSIINTGPNTVTLAAGTSHTIVGTTTTATLTSSRWRTRKTAASTYVTYRLSV